MHPYFRSPVWKQAPSLRIIMPLIAGIMIQWYFSFSLSYILICVTCFLAAFGAFTFFPSGIAYKLYPYRAIVFHLLIISVGMILTWQKDSRNHKNWYGHFLTDSSTLLVKINEPLLTKPRSVKAEVTVDAVINGTSTVSTKGKLLLYFSKDSLPYPLQYGDQILISNKLQAIKNSGNPGAFDYKRYAAFQLLYHQAFLKRNDWIATGTNDINPFQHFLFKTREYILSVLKKYIGNNQSELGIAEALLIGYREDLDKDLVQAYSNTGVVHIIAISGLHLGLIYVVLIWLINRIPFLNKTRHIKVLLLIGFLWTFSLLTGGSASVLRSAVMFTVIILGKYYFRQSAVYNSLAVSAFILLCYNPYYLWDVGFQLSYCAVLGIVAFQTFIYRKWFPPNWIAKQLWGMVSVTLAAQIGTFPVCIFYFHQFPNLFLFTNLAAVPLSTIILFGEILLIICSSFNWLANYMGIALTWLIRALNNIILFFNKFSFSLWEGIYSDLFTTLFLYGLVIFFMAWLIKKRKIQLKLALICCICFLALHGYAMIHRQKQKKIIMYNISRYKAVDFMYKDAYVFCGDSSLLTEGITQNFHLKPARIAFQAKNQKESLPYLFQHGNEWQFFNTRILMIDSSSLIPAVFPATDIILISHNPVVDIENWQFATKPVCIVFDASNPLWKIQKWKRACEALNLRCHSVAEEGAFVLDVNGP